MSDKGSQQGSIRAGYRRSRIEPVDPATISAPPPNAPSPNGQSRSPSVTSKSEDGEEKDSTIKIIVRIIFVFLNIVLMAFAIMMLLTGVILWIVFRDSGISVANVAGGLPLSKRRKRF